MLASAFAVTGFAVDNDLRVLAHSDVEGMDEIRRLEKVETVPVTDFPIEGVEVNRPKEPQIIDHVSLELFGQDYPKPVQVQNPKLPPCWK